MFAHTSLLAASFPLGLRGRGVLLSLFGILTIGFGCSAQPEGDPAVQALMDKGFESAWIESLSQRGEPRWYSGDELDLIGQPVGGQYAGQLYLGGDGRLWYWDIFNQAVIDPGGGGDKFYNTPMRPEDYQGVGSGFVLDIEGRAVALDARSFSDVRFRGEYPIARVQMSDEALPVSVGLEAFSPFCPTDSDASSIPATILSYTLTNNSDEAVTLRVGGWLENVSDRSGVQSGALMPVTQWSEQEVALTLSSQPQEQGGGEADLPVNDFEEGYGGWESEGDAFGDSPFVHAERADWQAIQGQQGDRLANSHNTRGGASAAQADAMTGTLTSPAFEVERAFLSFTVAGGAHDGVGVAGGEVSGATVVQVLIDDEVVAAIAGDNSNRHRAVAVDLGDYLGRQARIRIVDTHTGGWGNIQADAFVQTDVPERAAAAAAADSGTMALALLGRDGEPLDPEALPEHWLAALEAVGDVVPENAGVLTSEAITLAPGESIEIRFAVCWHFPNGHLGSLFPGEITGRADQRNYYTKFYDDAGEVATDLAVRHDELVATTRLWRDTWYDSTLPLWLLDRTFQNTSTLATTSAFRMHDPGNAAHDGRVYFWEGTYLGPGTCTHVTHYEQAFGRLFPDAARAQRSVTDFGVGWNDRLGYVQYRAEWGIGQHFGIPHAIDGHAGTILRTYREHTTSADDAFLRSIWPRVKRATQFMIDQDAGRGFFADLVPRDARNTEPDGILGGPQYHTLDKYWNGTIPWTSGMYLASLRATAEMARDMGDDAFADECTRIADLGEDKLADETFNEDYGYFVQRPEEDGDSLVNTNVGCHIDQMLGDYWTHQAGLDQVFPREQARSALSRIFEHNLYRRADDYRDDAMIKVHRFYADGDEPGTFICTFPHGGAREAVPSEGNNWDGLVVGYFSECMTGFTYQAAAHMIDEGLVLEGLALCRAAHDRYAEAPLRRNPFNEVEYGNHYTRAMSSYAAYIAMSGFEYHGPHAHIGFAPKLDADNFRGAFTAAEGWGTYQQQRVFAKLVCRVELRYGTLQLNTFSAELSGDYAGARVTHVSVNGQPAGRFEQAGDRLTVSFETPHTLQAGDSLEVEIHTR